MSQKSLLLSVSIILIVIGLGLTYFKVNYLHFPLTPQSESVIWQIGAKITFYPSATPTEIILQKPSLDSGLTVLSSHAQSAEAYNFSENTQHNGGKAVWQTSTELKGKQTLYYSINAIENHDIHYQPPQKINKPLYAGEKKIMADKLIFNMKKASDNKVQQAQYLIKQVSASENKTLMELFFTSPPDQASRCQWLKQLFSYAEINSRISIGLSTASTKRAQQPTYFIEVNYDNSWTVINPVTAEIGLPKGILLWSRGSESLFDVIGGKRSSLHFSVVKSPISATDAAIKAGKTDASTSTFLDFSLYSLPESSQRAFKTILLVPIGALIIAFLRILIGLRTSGTFMPILIALAFVETQLIPGLLMFVSIVSVGLLIRFLLSSLNLLLVARIASIIIIVIMIMALFSIISAKLQLQQVMTITFFPMIILAWTIERMSILWEEEGPKEVLIQGGGSLFMACLAYLTMSNSLIKHMSFNFPELLFVVLALLLMMGQYTGYRLTELARFRSLVKHYD